MSGPTTRPGQRLLRPRTGPCPARGEPSPRERRKPRARQRSPAEQRRYLRPGRLPRAPPAAAVTRRAQRRARAPPTCCGRREAEGSGSRASPAAGAAPAGPRGVKPAPRPAPPRRHWPRGCRDTSNGTCRPPRAQQRLPHLPRPRLSQARLLGQLQPGPLEPSLYARVKGILSL